MKARLEFTLPEEKHEYATLLRAGDMSSVIYEYSNVLRGYAKHNPKKPKSWDEVKEMWWQVLNDHNIDPYAE